MTRTFALIAVTSLLIFAVVDSFSIPGANLVRSWKSSGASTGEQASCKQFTGFSLSKTILNRASRPAGGTTMSLGKKSTAKDVIDHFKPNLRGKVAVVTGGNSGIGLETVKALTSAGCRVILASRSVEAANNAIEEEIKASGGRKISGGYSVAQPDIKVLPLDLADLVSINQFAKEVSREERIDYLVLNAGIMNTPKGYTKQGFEQQIGVNHFGHFHLTSLLLDKMKKQDDPSRIVVVASTAHGMGKMDFKDMHYRQRKYSAWGAYGQSKLANILFAKGLAERLRGSQVTAVSLHPGVIKTPLWRSSGGLLQKLVLPLIADKTVQQGASTTVYACLAQEGIKGGMYLDDCQEKKPRPQALDQASIDTLWQTTEQQLAEALGKLNLQELQQPMANSAF